MLSIICEIIFIVCGSMACIAIIGSVINCLIDIELIEAIHAQHMKCIRDNEWRKFFSVSYDDIYDFNIIQDCFPWLWRHKKHLPPEKYEVIKPFLSKKK